jgi:hypothetical protein
MYETPAPEELKKFMVENNLTGADIAAMTGVKPRTARSWIAPKSQKNARDIPWAAWAMVLLLMGKQSKKDIEKSVNKWKAEITGRRLFERANSGRPVKEQL